MFKYYLVCLFSVTIVIVAQLLRGGNKFTKILLLNSLTNIVVLIICSLSMTSATASYIDIALIYILLSFIATISYLKYFTCTKANRS